LSTKIAAKPVALRQNLTLRVDEYRHQYLIFTESKLAPLCSLGIAPGATVGDTY